MPQKVVIMPMKREAKPATIFVGVAIEQRVGCPLRLALAAGLPIRAQASSSVQSSFTINFPPLKSQ